MLYEISDFKKYKKLRWFFSRLIPIFTIIFLFITIYTWYLSYFHPKSYIFYVFFGIIIVFYTWWLIRWFEYIVLLSLWYFRYRGYQNLDLENIISWKPKTKLWKQIYLNIKKQNIKFDEIYHWVIIPTFQDPYEMIEDSIKSIVNSKFDNKKIIFTLAWEEKDKENYYNIFNKIKSKYWDNFLLFLDTLHPYWIKWELPWKGSNVTYSAKKCYNEIKKLWINYDKILVSVLDSESIVQDTYFSLLTLEYLYTKDYMKDKTIYQPMLFLFNRFFLSSFFSKIIAISTTFYILAASVKWIWTRAQAIQAQSLKSLLQTDFYSVETITEDWHQYYRTYCTFDWKFQVKPVYSYILLEPVIWKTIFESIKLQFNQIKRWAHWALDLPYIVICFLKNKNLLKLRTLYEIFWLIEASVLWGSLQFILFLGSIIFYLTWWIYSWIMVIYWFLWFVVLIILTLITLFFLPWKQLWKKRKILYEWFKYIFLSFTVAWPMLLFVNWLPALYTQLLILFWKPMWKFNVTKKYR